jgi:hypothetical protein
MPIRPELRKFYGPEWRRYRRVLIELAGGRCAKCRAVQGTFAGSLNGAHTTHDPRDMALVAIFCPSCHARHDAAHRYAMWRRNRARRAGQLWLLPGIEYAPYASWMIPTRVIAAAQAGLFAP